MIHKRIMHENLSNLSAGRHKLWNIKIYTITEDNARSVIGQNLLTIIPVNHMEKVVII